MASVSIQAGTLVIEAVALVLFVFGLLSATHGQTSIKVGPSFFMDGF